MDEHLRRSQTYGVDPVELFFDLVFVFAVSQLTHHLRDHLSARGVAQTAVILLAVFTVWYYTSWEATLVRIEHTRTVAMMLTVLFVGLFMNAAVTSAFAGSGWNFAVPFLLIQLGRGLWTLLNAPNEIWRDHYRRTILWLLTTSPLWVVGAAVDPVQRLYWWAAAAALDLLGTWLGHPAPGRRLHTESVGLAEAGHMLERCRLFLIIALGETILSTGVAIVAVPMTVMTGATGSAALVVTATLWMVAYGGPGRLVVRYVEDTRDPIHATRMAGNVLTVMVAGLIAAAAAFDMVITHPHGQPSAALSLLLFGGPILFLLAQGWYLWAVPRTSPRRWLVGSAALALAGAAAGAQAPPYVALLGAAVALAAVATVLTRFATGRT
ncbi:low temperature requirement protein A [Micromonospora sp. DPT]|uniref:low temperature requirement protein A n=1 Tax=Micromonospora sp. DPT TaxID=3142975 RepID=UPI003208BEA7